MHECSERRSDDKNDRENQQNIGSGKHRNLR
jgi:hypothetical protein